MRTIFQPNMVLRVLTVAVPLMIPTTAPAEVWTYRTADEVLVVRDFDGDGDRDFLIADRLSGQYLAGITGLSGTVAWGQPVDSGLPGIDDVAVGPITPGAALMEAAFVHAASNRVRVSEISTTPFPGSGSATFFPARVGPSGIALAAIDSFGAPAVEHPIVGTSLNGALPHALTFYQNNGDPTAWVEAEDTGASARRPATLQVYRPSPGGSPAVLLHMERGDPQPDSDVLRAITLDPGSGYPELFAMSGLPSEAEVLPAEFGSTPLALVYSPGTSLLVSMEIASGDTATAFTFSEGPVAQLFLLEETGGNAIAAVRADRSGVDLYDMDAVAGPSARLSIDLAGFPDELVTGVLGGVDGFELAIGPSTATGARTLASQRFSRAGDGSYIPGGRQSLSPFIGGGLGVFSNVVFFSDDPLTTPRSKRSILRQEAGSAWAHSETAVTGGVRLGNSRFNSPSAGLENSDTSTITGVAADTNRSLINQEADDISFAALGGVHGVLVADLMIDPPAGSYRSSVTPTISSSAPGATIHFRVGDGAWQTGESPVSVGALTSLSTVQFFASAPGSDAKSPISEATYSFAIPPDEIDTDGDGLPDFVERHLGLDPKASGWDADGDGFSDLEEAVAGSDPDQSASTPGPAAPEVHDDATLTIVATPRSISGLPGSVAADSPSATGSKDGDVRDTRIRVHDVAGGLQGVGLTKGLGFPSATIEGIPVGQARDFLVVSTPPTFWIIPSPGGTNPVAEPRGRETIALVPMPLTDPRSRTFADHVPGDAGSWIDTRRDYYAARTPISIAEDVTPESTLVALLFERVVSEIAIRRRSLARPSGAVTLTSFRHGEDTFLPDEDATSPSQRLRLPLDDFRALSEALIAGGGVEDAGFDLRDIFEGIRTEIEAGGKLNSDALIELASGLYALSAERGELAPGAYDSPFEVLRQFIRTPGFLPGDPAAKEGYAARLTQVDTAAASRAVGEIVDHYALPRELVTLSLEATPGGHDHVFLDLDSGQEAALYGSTLAPFEFEGQSVILPGTRLRVDAVALDPKRFSFLPVPDNAHRVISVRIVGLGDPSLVSTDTNHNLIDDAFERFFLPGGTSDPFTDSDGDGFSDLQESLDGTDPGNSNEHSSTPVELGPPTVRITIDEAGQPELDWDFPGAYAHHFRVDILQSDDLRGLSYRGQTEELSAGSVIIPAGGRRQFYRLLMRLK